MSVRPQELENPERDLELNNRRGRRREWPERKPELVPPPEPAKPEPKAEFLALLAAARQMRPGGLHWWECWRAGRDAAVAAIECGGLEAARAVKAPEALACRDCFNRGRDSVVSLMGGE